MIGRDPTGGRGLTAGERALAARVFGPALALDAVRIHRARWWPLQPRQVAMAPDGDLWLSPAGDLWCADFAQAAPPRQALFVHELVHVWQHQRGLCLPLRRHPFCRYAYTLEDGRPLRRYGIEQQAMIVQHGWGRIARGEPLGPYAPLLAELRGADQNLREMPK